MLPSVLFPQPYVVELSKLRQQLDEAHIAWAMEWKRQQLEFKLENIRFAHDPDWNTRLFSLQAAHDGKTWFWGAVHVVAGWGVMSI
jgi:hypothetical protein